MVTRIALTLLAADTHAGDLAALDGTRVWISGPFGTETLMMQRGTDPAAPVPGAVVARAYRGVDLGHDAQGRLVLTYTRCLMLVHRCSPIRDDLQDHRSTIRGLAPAGCSLSATPALWGTRVAYGVGCLKGSRGGLYVKTGSGAPRRLPLPRLAIRYHAGQITRVDLRGTRVGAIAADVYSYAFSESVKGHALRSFLAGASEGDGDDQVVGLAIGTGGALWSLTASEYAGDPNRAVVGHLTSTCQDTEAIVNPTGPDQESYFPAAGLGVDGTDMYLSTPAGIVQHAYAPAANVAGCGTPGS